MVFYPILGWGVFFISFVLAIVLFAVYRKLYIIFYLVSVALYIFTAGFAIDVFNLDEFAILMILVLSAVVFMLLGYYLSQVLALPSRVSVKD